MLKFSMISSNFFMLMRHFLSSEVYDEDDYDDDDGEKWFQEPPSDKSGG